MIDGGLIARKIDLSPDSQNLVDSVLAIDRNLPLSLDSGSIIKAFWDSPEARDAYNNRSEYQLNDSVNYFLDKIDDIAKASYEPTDQDILRSRVRTTGLTEKLYIIDGVEFQVIDVGGQRSERRKWIHCFQDVTAIIFLASLSAYDSVLLEDDSTNRLEEAVSLFQTIVTSPWFTNTGLVLFLNKDDLFSDKIATKSIRNPKKGWFLDYDGGHDATKAYEYISNLFKMVTPSDKQVFHHRTTATNTENMRSVFSGVREIIVRQVMRASTGQDDDVLVTSSGHNNDGDSDSEDWWVRWSDT